MLELTLDMAKNYLPSCLHCILTILNFFLREKGLVGLQSVTESIEDNL